MGRLVLNVLLSFAQFEREMISERTRDKIAAAWAVGWYQSGCGGAEMTTSWAICRCWSTDGWVGCLGRWDERASAAWLRSGR